LTSLAEKTGAILIVVTHSPALAEMFPKKLGMMDGQLQTEP
jgi:ABC-type lipoprotein export system ATPase subunit